MVLAHDRTGFSVKSIFALIIVRSNNKRRHFGNVYWGCVDEHYLVASLSLNISTMKWYIQLLVLVATVSSIANAVKVSKRSRRSVEFANNLNLEAELVRTKRKFDEATLHRAKRNRVPDPELPRSKRTKRAYEANKEASLQRMKRGPMEPEIALKRAKRLPEVSLLRMKRNQGALQRVKRDPALEKTIRQLKSRQASTALKRRKKSGPHNRHANRQNSMNELRRTKIALQRRRSENARKHKNRRMNQRQMYRGHKAHRRQNKMVKKHATGSAKQHHVQRHTL